MCPACMPKKRQLLSVSKARAVTKTHLYNTDAMDAGTSRTTYCTTA
jgi:hypothetical protein